MERKNCVIVYGSSHHNTLGVVRSLGEAGVRPYLILKGQKDICNVSRSKYVVKSWMFPTYEKCIQCLTDYFGGLSAKSIIISTTDSATLSLDDNYDCLRESFILPLPEKRGMISYYMDKSKISEFANNCGMKTPQSWVVGNKIVPDDVVYPCLAKPLSSLTGHKSDIKVCNKRCDLISLVADETHCKEYIVQEYIKKEKEISILGCVLNNRCEIVYSGCIDKLREGGMGSSSFAVMIENTFFKSEIDKLTRLLLKTGYTGLFSAEYLLKDGVYYFLEVNFRNDGNGYVPTKSGLNLPYIWYCSCLDKSYSIGGLQGSYPCYFMEEISDFFNIIRKKITIKEWIRSVRRADCFLTYNKRDKWPFYGTVASMISYQITKR